MLASGLLLSALLVSFRVYPPFLFSLSFGWLLGLLLLGGFYILVRRMGRPMLSLVWAYAFAESVIIGIVALFIHMIGAGVDWWWFALTSTILLIRFAGKASRISFSHGLLLVGLSPVLLGPTSIIPPIVEYIGASEVSYFNASGRLLISWSPIWLFLLRDCVPYLIGVAHILYAVWVLAHVDSVGRVPKKAVVALFALAAVSQVAWGLSNVAVALFFTGPDIDVFFDGFSREYWRLGYWAVSYAVVILIVYRYDLVTMSLRRFWDGLYDELHVGTTNGRNDAQSRVD